MRNTALQRIMTRPPMHVPVVDDGRPLGMIARHDLLKLMLETLPGAGAEGPTGGK